MTPERLSAELRGGDNADLRRRRWIIGLSFLRAAIGQVVALYQLHGGHLNRATESPILPIAMGARTANDAATCVKPSFLARARASRGDPRCAEVDAVNDPTYPTQPGPQPTAPQPRPGPSSPPQPQPPHPQPPDPGRQK